MIETVVGMLCFGPWYHWLPEAKKALARDHMMRAVKAMYDCQPKPIVSGDQLNRPTEQAMHHFIERLSVMLWLFLSANDKPIEHPLAWTKRLAWIVDDGSWTTRKTLSLWVPMIPLGSTTASIEDAVRFADELNAAGYSSVATEFSNWAEKKYLINRSVDKCENRTDVKYLSIMHNKY